MAERDDTFQAVAATQLKRRGPPMLHLLYAQRWGHVLDMVGYRYIGTTNGFDAQDTVCTPPWQSETYLRVGPDSRPTLFENRCPHQGNVLVGPAKDGMRRLRPRELVCSYHGLRFRHDGTVADSSKLEVPSDQVPCLSRRKLWQKHGLVFELGDRADGAVRELEAAFSLLEGCLDITPMVCPSARLGYLHSPETASGLMTLINFLDIPHVKQIHASQASLSGLVQEGTYVHDRIGDLAVIQCMGLNPGWWDTPWGSEYHKSGLPPPKYGAVWLTTRMGWMAEVYPGVFTLSQCRAHPTDWRQCSLHHQFFYHPNFKPEGIPHQMAVFQMTAGEDTVHCARATDYVATLIRQGKGWQPWGFFSPTGENFGHWHYAGVEELLREFFPRDFPGSR